jgi:hypothetical protein
MVAVLVVFACVVFWGLLFGTLDTAIEKAKEEEDGDA